MTSRTCVFHPRKICQCQSWEHTLVLTKSTLIEIFLQAIYWCLTCICYFISNFWNKQVFSLYNFNILLGYACLPGSSGQRCKWSDWHFMERSRCPKRYFFLLVNLLPNFRCNCSSRRKLGLVHVRKDFWDCYKVWKLANTSPASR